MLTLQQLPPHVFGLLRRIDAEATTQLPTGAFTGLSDYGRHARPELKKPQAEREWSRRLAQLVTPHVAKAQAEVRYPPYAISKESRWQSCDNVFALANATAFWLEIKGAWRDYWGGNHRIYRSYLLHPLVPGLDRRKTHTVPLDLEKLSRLRTPDADYIAELLVGFERPDDPMDRDVETLVELARLGDWSCSTDSWPSVTVPNQIIRTWLWYRPTLA